MLGRLKGDHPVHHIQPVISAQEVIACQKAVREVHVDEKVQQYILQIVQDTREHDDISLGGSPRASIALMRSAQAMAALRGRDFVLPDDIKTVVNPILQHRLILKPESRLRRVTAAEIIDEIVNSIAVPTVAGEVGSG